MEIVGSSLRWIRILVVAALLAAISGVANAPPAVAAGVEPPPTSATQAKPTHGPHVDWESCGEDLPGYDCAIVKAPLDYDRPFRGATQLALARYRATDTEGRIGSVFVNPGGPGGSGVGFVLSGFGEFLGAQLDGRFDVLGFDPRGVGASDPLHCFDSEEELGAFFADQPLFPYLKHQYRPFFDAYARLGRDCHDERIARHMSTADVARDMDVLRRAVGDPKLTYLGFSYGSYLGNTYANLFPGRVRALAIDGVLDPRLWSSGWQIKSDRVATQQVVDEILRLCDEAQSECAFWTPEGSKSRWERLVAAIRHEPLELVEGFFYTYDFLIADAISITYAPEVWDDAAAFLDFVADAALDDDRAAAAAAVGQRTALMAQLTAGFEEADYPNGFDAYLGNHCADAEYPHEFRRWLEVSTYAERGSRLGPYWWWTNAGCARWPVNEDRYIGPWKARTSAPVLVVGNYFDGATDYAGAVATDRLLRKSRLLSYAGWGHTAYGRSQCVTEHVNTYLLTVSLPPRGEVCPANPNPFLPGVGARASVAQPLVGLPPVWLTRPELPHETH